MRVPKLSKDTIQTILGKNNPYSSNPEKTFKAAAEELYVNNLELFKVIATYSSKASKSSREKDSISIGMLLTYLLIKAQLDSNKLKSFFDFEAEIEEKTYGNQPPLSDVEGGPETSN